MTSTPSTPAATGGRNDGRVPNQLRPVKIVPDYLKFAEGSVLIRVGDTRVICATHRDLEEMVGSATFREDLFYRINVVAIRVPSLRERAEDVPLLCDYFLGVFAAHYRREKKGISRDAVRRLQGYHWPGNVRQLENLLLNAFVLSEGAQIELEDLAIPELSCVPHGPSLSNMECGSLLPLRLGTACCAPTCRYTSALREVYSEPQSGEGSSVHLRRSNFARCRCFRRSSAQLET